MGGWPGMGPRLICPGIKYNEHELLASYLDECKRYATEIEENKKLEAKGADALSYLRETLELRLEEREKQIDDLRALFDCDDVKGEPTERRSYRCGFRCTPTTSLR